MEPIPVGIHYWRRVAWLKVRSLVPSFDRWCAARYLRRHQRPAINRFGYISDRFGMFGERNDWTEEQYEAWIAAGRPGGQSGE